VKLSIVGCCISYTHADNLPPNVGLLSGDLCQHRGIHFLANDTKLAGPVISLNGGRFPPTTAAFIWSSLIAGKHHVKAHEWHSKVCGNCFKIFSYYKEIIHLHLTFIQPVRLLQASTIWHYWSGRSAGLTKQMSFLSSNQQRKITEVQKSCNILSDYCTT